MIAVIFSKDRALQLDATIQSLYRRCVDTEKLKVAVLYTTSSDIFEKQYLELIEEYPDIKFVKENDFKQNLINIIITSFQGYVMFVVDDTIFVKDFSVKEIIESLENNLDSIGVSLRLGANNTYCYMSSKDQKLPGFEVVQDKLKFVWSGQDGDFGYPLELSSSVYRIPEVLVPINFKEFTNPNMLESNLYKSISFFEKILPTLLCYKTSRAFSNPINIVQKKKTNKHGNDKKYTPEELAKLYNLKYRIDIDKYFNTTPKSVHQEEQLYLKEVE